MRQLKIATQITNRDSQAVEKYLQEVSKKPMITPDEENKLSIERDIALQEGNAVEYQKKVDQLVEANLRFVVSVAKQYQHQGLALSDLINEGNMGLIKAAQRFDHTRGFKFISYAVWRIRQSILQGLAEQGRLVRLPQNKIGTYNKTTKAINAFEQEYEREPTNAELAEIMEIDEKEINNIRISNTRHSSLDAPLHEEADMTMGDLIKAESEEITAVFTFSNPEELSDTVKRMLEIATSLTEREKEITLAYFGFEGLNLEQICRKYNLTKERVRQIKERAIKKLQKKQKSIKRVVGGDEYNKKESLGSNQYRSGRPYNTYKTPVFSDTSTATISPQKTENKRQNKKASQKPYTPRKKISITELLPDENQIGKLASSTIGNITKNIQEEINNTLIGTKKPEATIEDVITTSALQEAVQQTVISDTNALETEIIEPSTDTVEQNTFKDFLIYEEKMSVIIEKKYNWELQLDVLVLPTMQKRCITTFMKHYIAVKGSSAGKRYGYNQLLRDARLRTGLLINQDQFNTYIHDFLNDIKDL